jgi:hypothetical protein
MRGGGTGATVEFNRLGLGSADSAAPIVAPLALICAVGAEPPPRPAEPPLRANEAAGVAKTMTNAIATFTGVFDMGKLHLSDFTERPGELT